MKYIAKGLVLGNYWGGGSGTYSTIKFHADTMEDLESKIEKAFDDGSIDSGMGYESLIGAVLNVEEIDTKIIDDKEYKHSEYDTLYVGIFTDDELEFIDRVNLNS